MSSENDSDSSKTENKSHLAGNKDIYKGAKKSRPHFDNPPIPAATLILLRDGKDGVEVLMLRKNPEISFGGLWVFPGGRIDAADYPADKDAVVAAQQAAARETQEEAGISTDAENFVMFSQWSPPPITEKRYKTLFFATRAPEECQITIDGGEIHDHQWIRPSEAIRRRDAREIDLIPPTWVTLHTLSQHQDTDSLLKHLESAPLRVYETRAGKSEEGDRIVFWYGDAGYDEWDASIEGPRHRLTMKKEQFIFEDTVNP